MATSQLAGGVNFTSVSYFDTHGNRIVKGPLGIVETYKFTTLQGVPKVTEIDRAANGTVAFASRRLHLRLQRLSRRAPPTGTATRHGYTNNSHGLPTADRLCLRLDRQPHDQHHL